MTKNLLLVICFAVFSSAFAQQSKGTTSNPVKGKEFLLQNSSEASRARTLIRDLQDAIYVTSQEPIKSFGANPTIVYVDATAFPAFNPSEIEAGKRGSIEAVTIRIDSPAALQQTFDLSKLNIFPNLKYVYLLSLVDTTPQALLQKITNQGANLRVIYDIEKGS